MPTVHKAHLRPARGNLGLEGGGGLSTLCSLVTAWPGRFAMASVALAGTGLLVAYAPGIGTASYCCSPGATGAGSERIAAGGAYGLGGAMPPYGAGGAISAKTL